MSAKHKSKGKNYRARNDNDHDDFFPTYHALTRLYLEKVKFNKDDLILEPCAGNGDITKVLREFGHNPLQSDINPRNKEIKKLDFLKSSNFPVNHIITNPPFKLSIEFMQKSSEVATDSISFIWPLDYLHGVDRYEKIYDNGINGFFLDTVFPFVRRPLFGKQYHPAGPMPTGATSFAWFLFKHKYKKDPKIVWLHNNNEMGVPWDADEQLFEGLL
jgi:hypothetical protein